MSSTGSASDPTARLARLADELNVTLRSLSLHDARQGRDSATHAIARETPRTEIEKMLQEAAAAKKQIQLARQNVEELSERRSAAERAMRGAEAQREQLAQRVDVAWGELSTVVATATPSERAGRMAESSPAGTDAGTVLISVGLSIDQTSSVLLSNGHIDVCIDAKGEVPSDDALYLISSNSNPPYTPPVSLTSALSYERLEYTDERRRIRIPLPDCASTFDCLYVHCTPTSTVVLSAVRFEVTGQLRTVLPSELVKLRRSASPMSDSPIWSLVENMLNIRTINVSMGLPACDGARITRVTCWLVDLSSELFVELDCYESTACKTIFFKLDLPNVVYTGCSYSIASSGRTVHARLPYAQPTTPFATTANTAMKNGIEIRCSFCTQTVVEEGIVTNVSALPSGALDFMMHEFICGECSTTPLVAADLECLPNQALTNDIYIAVNARDTTASAIRVKCKSTPSVFDSIYGYGNTMRHSAICCSAASLVDVSTFALHCSRCSSYLGDGTISGDAATAAPDTSETLSFDDIATVRLLLNTVTVHSNEATAGVEAQATAEQVISRGMLHLNHVHSLTLFKLVADQSSAIEIKILSVKYQASVATRLTDSFVARNAIKCKFKIVNAPPLGKSSAAEVTSIVVRRYDFDKILLGLQERSVVIESLLGEITSADSFVSSFLLL